MSRAEDKKTQVIEQLADLRDKRIEAAKKLKEIDDNIDRILLDSEFLLKNNNEVANEILKLGTCFAASDGTQYELDVVREENYGGHYDTLFKIRNKGCNRDGHGCCCSRKSFSLVKLLRDWILYEKRY